MQFIPIVETHPNNPKIAAPYSVSAQQYGEFLCKIWDLWMADFKDGVPTTSVRHFDSIFHTYVGIDAPECTLCRECGVYVVLEHNGNAYSCDFFVDPKWKLGNVMHNRIIDMLNSKKQQEFGKIKAAVPVFCKRCKWFKSCFGGCIKDRIKDPRDKRRSHFCISYKMFMEHAHQDLLKLAADWKKKQVEEQEQHKKIVQQQKDKGIYDAFNDFL